MSEDVGSLVVRVAMDNSNFQQGVQGLNRSLKMVQSDFKATTASLGDHGKGMEGLKAKSEMLSKSIGLQSEIVDKYRGKLNDSKDTLEKNKEEHIKLKDKVDLAKKAFQESEKSIGKNSEKTKNLKEEYEKLNKEYVNSEEKLRNNVRAIENWEVKTNNAKTKLSQLGNELIKTSKELDIQGNKWTQFSQKLEPIGEKFSVAGGHITSVGKGLSVISAPFLAIGAAGVKVAADFEQGLSNIKAVSGATTDEMKKLEGLALDLGAKTSFSASEAAAGIEELIKAGLTTEQVLSGGLAGALDLAAAGELNLAEAAEIASTALNAFKDDNLSVSKAADILAGAANASATDVKELKFGLSMVSAVASGVGLSFKDTSTALAIFAQNGLKGSDAGTSLKTMLLNLQPKTDKQYEAFERLGLMTYDVSKAYEYLKSQGVTPTAKSFEAVDNALKKHSAQMVGAKENSKKAQKQYEELLNITGAYQSAFYDQEGRLKSMDEISKLLRDSMTGLTDAQRQQTMQTMFGTDAIRAANILFKEGAEGFDKMSASMSEITAAETAEEKLNNLKGAIEEMQGSIETALITIGTKAIPTIRGIAEVVDETVDKFNNLSPGMQDFIIKTGLVIGVTGPAVLGIGMLSSAIGGTITTVSTIAGLLGKTAIATGGVGTAATIATGAGGAGGLAGLATGLSGVAIAAAPFVLAGAAVAGVGYAVHKSMNEEAIPAVDLFANKVEGATDKVITQANAMEVANQTTVTTISEGTKKAVGAYIELDDKARQAMNNLYVTGTTVTGQMVTDITAQYVQMGQQVNTQLETDKKKETDILQNFFNKSSVMTKEEEAKLIDSTSKYYTDKQSLTNEANKRIEEILKNASEQKRSLSREEKEEINKIQNEQRVNAVNILSEQEVEAKAILERIKEYDGRITAEQASEHIKQLNKQRDESIEAADEEYKETVAAIIRKRDESKTITAEQAEALINEAERQKRETINKAEETRDSAVATMVNQNEQLVGSVDLATGKILSKLDKLISKWDGWEPKVKTFINDYVVRTTYEGSPRLKDAPNIGAGTVPWEIPGKWTGDSNFKGGLSYVGERGRELLVYPGGGIDITANSTELRNLPQGTKIFNNQDTEKILSGGAGKKIPGFAKGNTSLGSNYGVQNNLVTLEVNINNNKDDMLKDAKDLANKIIKEVETDLSVKPLINISDDTLKRNTLNTLKQGEKARLDYSEFLGKLNADEVERSIKILDKEYKANVANINKKINALKDGDKKKNKASLDNARKELSTLKENNKETLSLLKERNTEINELAKEDINIFKDRMTQYDEAIKRLSISSKDLDQDLLNQNAIVVLQQKRITELTAKYAELVKKFGATSEESLKMKKSLEEAKTELIKMSDTVYETSEKIKQSQINEINDLSSRITNALKAKYDEELKMQQQAIKAELEQLEKWKKESIDKINSVYDSRIKRIEEVTNVQIKALQDELKALDKAEQQKSRAEQNSESLKGIDKLKSAIEYEHNEFNKAELQKKLNEEIKAREEMLNKWQVEDKKESLNQQITNIQENAKLEKEILETRKQEELARTNDLYTHEKEMLDKRLLDYQETYDRLTEKSRLRSEVEKMIMNETQDEIIKLLHSYEDQYERAGNSLGERLLEGMQPAIDKIMTSIANINGALKNSTRTSISNGVGAVISGGASTGLPQGQGIGSDKYREDNPDMPDWLGGGKPTVNNNVTINSPKALSHSDIKRETETTLRKLSFSM